MSGSGLDDIFSGGGSGGGTTAQPTPTSGTPYTRENFPYREYADEIGFKWDMMPRDDSDIADLFRHYQKAGSTWKSAADAAAANPPPTTIPAFMPGNQSAIAQQLALGYGGTPDSFMQSPLMQLFQPMTLPPATFTPPKSTDSKKK